MVGSGSASARILVLFLLGFLRTSLAKDVFVAVPDFQVSGVDSAIGRKLEAVLEANLIRSGGYRVLERREMAAILREQVFEAAACSGPSCGAKMGRLLGVDEVLLGQLGVFEGVWAFSLRRVDVSTGSIVQDLSTEFAEADSVAAFLSSPIVLNKNADVHGHNARFKETLPFAVQLSLGGIGVEDPIPLVETAPLLALQFSLARGRMLYLIGVEAAMILGTPEAAGSGETMLPKGSGYGFAKMRLAVGCDLVRSHRWTLAPLVGIVDGTIHLSREDESQHETIDLFGMEYGVRMARNWWFLRAEGTDKDVMGGALYLDISRREYVDPSPYAPERTIFACAGFQLLLSFL